MRQPLGRCGGIGGCAEVGAEDGRVADGSDFGLGATLNLPDAGLQKRTGLDCRFLASGA